jgi:hypothetical protein
MVIIERNMHLTTKMPDSAEPGHDSSNWLSSLPYWQFISVG